MIRVSARGVRSCVDGAIFLSRGGAPNYRLPVQTTVGRVFSTTAIALTALLLSNASLAAEPNEGGGDGAASSDAGPARGRPLPRDDRKGHVSAFASIAVVVPAGDLGAGVPRLTATEKSGIVIPQVLGTGVGGEAGIVLGLSRYSGLELRGQFVKFSPAYDCLRAYDSAKERAARTGLDEAKVPTCDAQMFAVGLGLTFHTSQALGFDPWVRFGTGYRALTATGPLADISPTAPKAGTFHGIDVIDLTLGGDYFPTPWLGFGIFLSGVVGIDVRAPSTQAQGAVYGLFQAGFRIALEPQRKAVTVASSAPHGATTVAERLDFHPALYNRAAQ